jgi:UDP-GlcNAc:undecaprenyl-phosphate GlcNAc-1-phosphate transferase
MKLQRHIAGSSSLSRVVTWLRTNRTLRRVPLVLIAAVTPAIMLLGSLWVAQVPKDFAAIAAVLAALVALELFLSRAASSMLVRLAIYVTAIFSAYLMIHYPGIVRRPVDTVTLVVMVLLAVAIAAYVRFTAEQKFGTTPTDYLIVFGILALTVFGSIDIGSHAVVELVFYATVLMYGCEVVIDRSAYRPMLHVSTLVTLAVLAIRGAL